MFNKIAAIFIKNHRDVKDQKVRGAYGIMVSVIAIICNALMGGFKLLMAFLTNSTAIAADAYNNLADIASNVAVLCGFKLADKHPDAEHPYGHGRSEYIVGMLLAFLILAVALSALKEAILKIFYPEPLIFSYAAIIILIVAILLKLFLAYLDMEAYKAIDSVALKAAAYDSINDIFSTLATLASLILSLYVSFPVDGIIGLLVSLWVLKSGIGIFKEMMDALLGKAIDKELVSEVTAEVLKDEEALGIHDLMIHDYGPGRKYMTLHVEVNCHHDINQIHEAIDAIERNLLHKYNLLTTIHMDPIDPDDPLTNELKGVIEDIVKKIDDHYSIHDLRIVKGQKVSNLVFDVVLPSDDQSDHKVVKDLIAAAIKAKYGERFHCVMTVEHAYY